MNFDFDTLPTNRQNGSSLTNNEKNKHWRLKVKRGSSLDNELSIIQSMEDDLENDILSYETHHQYGGINFRAASSMSENNGLSTIGTIGNSSTLPNVHRQQQQQQKTINNESINKNNSFRFSNDEINQFQRQETLDSNGGDIGPGRSTRATTPGDEQIFQEPIESLQSRIGRLLSSEEMCDMHFLVGSGPVPIQSQQLQPLSALTLAGSSVTPNGNQSNTFQLNHQTNINSNSNNNSLESNGIGLNQPTGSSTTPPPLRKLRIPAHRLIMASASPVFKQMLFNMANNRMYECDDDIEINDIDPAAFLEFLRYAYTDSARLNKDNVVGVLVAARRYQITNLERQCIDYIHKCLAKKSCIAIWLASRTYSDTELEKVSLRSVQHYAESVLLSNDFLRADLQSICEILSDDLLRADEITIFRALTRWGKQTCLRMSICPSRANVRTIIGGALNLVRFPLMTEEQVQRVVATEGILEDELIRSLLHYARHWPKVANLMASTGTPLAFPTEPRTYQKITKSDDEQKQVYRFASFENTLPNRYVNRSLNFVTNKRIWLTGVGLYSPRKACTFYLNVWVRVRRADYETQRWISPMDRVEQTVLLKYDGTGTILTVKFDEPLQVEANVNYEVAACVTPTARSTSLVRARLHPHLYYTRPGDVNFYYGTEGQYATKVRINQQQNVIFNFNWERDNVSVHDDSQSDSVSNNFFVPTASSEPTTPNPPPRPPPPQEYRRPSRMQRLRRALSFIDRREDPMHAARESGLLEGQIPVLYFFA
ncbi:hypothetical protein RDWZM_004304 [Blomia tropicalis]|uniref:BTB domain-containing protein n=1 Tax=Blomia tropicalis TaxID=40697 RepID=A0A9Q0RTD8_BLOTA|nr:hypothetical protein RDWZM_004304 [Blomia tropicalis]